MIPKLLSTETRRIFRGLVSDLADAHGKMILANRDPRADEFDVGRATDARDDAHADLVAMMREMIVGPRDPGQFGGVYHGHKACVIGDTMYVLIEARRSMGIDEAVVIPIPVEAIAFDDAAGEAELLGLRDALAGAESDK